MHIAFGGRIGGAEMRQLDYFDQQLLGYLREHPNALFHDAAQALGVHTIAVDHRVQNLLNSGFLTMDPQGAFHLTKQALAVCTSITIPPDETPFFTEFSWDELYIPLDLT